MPALYKQGDLVSLNEELELPNGEKLFHYILILSSNSSNSYEQHYTGVMLSSTTKRDRYSFLCDDSMFEAKLKPNSQLRLYIIAGIHEKYIRKLENRIKPSVKTTYLKIIIEQVNELIFCID